MSKTLRVLLNEILVTVSRRSFLLVALGLPVASFVVFTIVGSLNRNAPSTLSALLEGPQQVTAEGYVDQAGLIKILPESLPEGALLAFSDEASARRALEAGEISGYSIIPADFLESGEVISVQPDFSPFNAFEQLGLVEQILRLNLVGGDEDLAARLSFPFFLVEESLAPEPQRDEDNPLTFFIPYVVTLIFYAVILMSASFLLNSVTKEKENRVIEILMSSVSPRELLVGKILGLGVVGLLQTALWAGTGFLLLRLGGRTASLPAGFDLPVSILAWGVVYFLLGYTIYASLMASLGALVPNLREASQATFVIILPMIIPLMFISLLIEDPGGRVAVAMSLFPLTAPVTMMTRLAAGTVPAWQLAVSVVLMLVTAAIVLQTVARLFRAQTLLSGQPFNVRRMLSALMGRAG